MYMRRVLYCAEIKRDAKKVGWGWGGERWEIRSRICVRESAVDGQCFVEIRFPESGQRYRCYLARLPASPSANSNVLLARKARC
jgi:hypothetical protein